MRTSFTNGGNLALSCSICLVLLSCRTLSDSEDAQVRDYALSPTPAAQEPKTNPASPSTSSRLDAFPDTRIGYLLSRYDSNQDGVIQRTEYDRSEATWGRLDHNQDGQIDDRDFSGSRSRKARAAMKDTKSRGSKSDAANVSDSLEIARVGELAPDFHLSLADGSGRVRLSDFRWDRPVALIFGSYT